MPIQWPVGAKYELHHVDILGQGFSAVIVNEVPGDNMEELTNTVSRESAEASQSVIEMVRNPAQTMAVLNTASVQTSRV